MEEKNSVDSTTQRETCAYRGDNRHLRNRQLGCNNISTENGPTYVSSPKMSAIDIYPY